ncbi:hypothetical protein [Singulisphaera sp. PoT]|uniref:hypothetical protein n=1 Tax=Singulisphaera sp. PoT TaxID=3411797 RepID=UPI003BF5591B
MIELIETKNEYTVLINGREIGLLDSGEDYVLVECELSDLENVSISDFPEKLTIQIQSAEGFGTYFFHELRLTSHDGGIALDFDCQTPNKYWEGRYGLASMINSINKQAVHFDNLSVEGFEIEDDWKGITIRRLVSFGDPVSQAIKLAASDLMRLMKAAEIALGGLEWKTAYESDEELFCQEVLLPLLRRMGFLLVRYTHGRREYGHFSLIPTVLGPRVTPLAPWAPPLVSIHHLRSAPDRHATDFVSPSRACSDGP